MLELIKGSHENKKKAFTVRSPMCTRENKGRFTLNLTEAGLAHVLSGSQALIRNYVRRKNIARFGHRI